ncbi:non-ribosomal peptide synthetase [Streptomyces sp. NPDC020875]|uniref:non-ribosomal peptide synthetase n=1 Tax=Streptomyces sp. NPDC020875 TaxID=3154898 RepID=UPI0033E61FB4
MHRLIEVPGGTADSYTAADATAASNQNLPAAIVTQAALHPERPAVLYENKQVTYRQLVNRARHLAVQLLEAGAGRETTVAVCLSRGPDLVVAILGVWLAGGACLMMDPAAPPLRREHMLRDSGTRIAITQPDLGGVFPSSCTLLFPQDCTAADATDESGGIVTDIKANDLAYVIYTSGTTGLPKGVMVEHAAVSAMADSMERSLNADASQAQEVRRVALNGGTSADPFFADFANLAYGRTLVVVDEQTRRDPERLGRLLAEHQVDLFDGTPTQIRALLLACGVEALASLRVLILGSEPTDQELWRQLRSLTHLRAYNYYGPTETTVYVTGAALAQRPDPVIGTALPGNRIWIVDQELRPVPAGQTGEICVTGPQLARGYLNAGPAEQARFTTLQTTDAATPLRAYRTGDRGRYNAAGQIEFLGRFDNQVSIHGHRVELGEIDAALRSCPGVGNTAVALNGDSEATVLTAWVVLDKGVSTDEVRATLASSLPPHMLPRLIPVSTIPMSLAGKADIHTLSTAATTPPAPPARHDELRDTLHALWSTTLSVTRIEPADDFFALGGDSLKATKMIMAARQQLRLALPIRTIFDHPRFEEFHQAIDRATVQAPEPRVAASSR